MKAIIPTTKEVEVTHVKLNVAVRYDEEDIPNDFPFRKGDMWCPLIEIESGRIVDWPQGVTADFHMKVCDEGTYQLLDKDGAEVLAIEENYVPNRLIPGEYGDYITMQIDETGLITNWPEDPSIEDFYNLED